MPLTRFAQEGSLLEIRVPWWPVTLFFAPDRRDAEVLGREGIGQERVWTARELVALVNGRPLGPEGLRAIALVRREFGGDLVDVLTCRAEIP